MTAGVADVRPDLSQSVGAGARAALSARAGGELIVEHRRNDPSAGLRMGARVKAFQKGRPGVRSRTGVALRPGPNLALSFS